MFVLRDFILFRVKPFWLQDFHLRSALGASFSKNPPTHYLICSVITFLWYFLLGFCFTLQWSWPLQRASWSSMWSYRSSSTRLFALTAHLTCWSQSLLHGVRIPDPDLIPSSNRVIYLTSLLQFSIAICIDFSIEQLVIFWPRGFVQILHPTILLNAIWSFVTLLVQSNSTFAFLSIHLSKIWMMGGIYYHQVKWIQSDRLDSEPNSNQLFQQEKM